MSFTKLLRKEWLVALLLLLASTLVVLLFYLQYNQPVKGMNSAGPLNWNGDALTLSKGQGYSGHGKLVIKELAKEGVAVASLSPATFQADDYPYVNWVITDAAPGVEMELLWHTAENRTFTRPFVWVPHNESPLQMAEDKNWRGQITGLALVIKGTLATPITVAGISLGSASSQRAPLNTVKKWFALDRWKGTSINYVDEDAVEQGAPPVLTIAAIILLALASYLILAKIRILPLNIAVVWGMMFFCWLALDVRWQANLFRQLDLTRQQFSGKSWEDKHLAAEDGQLFDLMQKIKTKLQPTQSHVFLFADDAYTRGRSAYHLLPLNVMSSRDLFSAGQFKSGDFIIILGKDDVEFDPSLNLMKWEPQQQLKADLLLLAANNVLLRVR